MSKFGMWLETGQLIGFHRSSEVSSQAAHVQCALARPLPTRRLTGSKKTMEEAMAEAIGLHALGVAPCASSSFKFRGHDSMTLDHKVAVEGSGPLDGTGMSCAMSRFHCCPVPG